MSADDIVDVVDEHGRPLSTARRADVRRLNLRHRSCYVLVFDSRQRLFVHRRTLTKDLYPGYWDVTIGGVLDAGEDFEAAALRELAEELGLRGAVLQPLFPFRFEDDLNRVIGRVFQVESDGPFVLQAAEILEGQWLELDDVEEYLERQPFCPDGAEVFRLYRSRPRAAAASLARRA